MKAKLLAIALLLGASTSVMAQQPQQQAPKAAKQQQKAQQKVESASDRAQKLTDKMTKDLSLTTDQATKVQAINLKYAQQRQETMTTAKEQAKQAGSKLTQEERKVLQAQMKSSIQAKNEELKTVLSDKQYKKLTKDQKKAAKKMKGKVQEVEDEYGYAIDDK